MKNCFQGVGILSECRIDLYSNYVKIRFSLDINNKTITFHYRKSKKFQTNEYNQVIRLIPFLHPKVDGYVFTDGEKKYYILSCNNQPCRLFVSGNIFTTKDSVYFNAEFISLSDKKDFFNIEIDGVFVDRDMFLNITNDAPIVLNICGFPNYNNYYFRANLSYEGNYIQKNNIIKPYLNKRDFKIKSMRKLEHNMSDKLKQNYLLEWEIMNNAKR